MYQYSYLVNLWWITSEALKEIFKLCMENHVKWKNANVVPVHKKWQITLRKLNFVATCLWQDIKTTNLKIKIFTDSELISSNKWGFKQRKSCINQLLCITHDIYLSFDDGLETRAVFLDISKAFDKVWERGLLYQLKQNDISGNPLNIITGFLILRKQRVVLSVQHSIWINIAAGVPEVLIPGQLFFLIYIRKYRYVHQMI